MSDTEDASGFDKEAEKEKLRAQLAREEENRRSTRHMSELLLKGATMTNKHCDTCGDPLFRYEGQEFCPSCTQEGATAGEAPAEGEGSGDAEPADRGPAAGAPAPEDGPAAATPPPAPTPAERPAPSTPGRPDERPEDVAGARAALTRKLADLAARAEATEDVARSRELLAAAREAAEALAAIHRIGE